MRRIIQKLLCLLVVCSFLLFTGCGSSNSGDSPSPPNQKTQPTSPLPTPTPSTPSTPPIPKTNTAPSLQVLTPPGTQSGTVILNYTLTDPESDTCSVKVEYSLDGGATWKPATSGGGDGNAGGASNEQTDIASSENGTDHQYLWDSGSDIKDKKKHKKARIRIIAADGIAGVGTGESQTFSFQNNFGNGNGSGHVRAKIIAIANPGSTQRINVIYKLYDDYSCKASVKVEWSRDDGVIWNTCTQYKATGKPNPLLNGDSISNLDTSPNGTTHIFVWNVKLEKILDDDDEVQVRVVPTCSGTGTEDTTQKFPITGWSAPVKIVGDQSGEFSMAVDSKNNLYCVWSQNLSPHTNSDSGYKIFYMKFDGKNWSETFEVSNIKKYYNDYRSPEIFIDSRDKVYVTFVGYRWIGDSYTDLYYRTFDGKNWSSPVLLHSFKSRIYNLKVLMDSRDNFHYLWGSSEGYWYARRVGNLLTTPVKVAETGEVQKVIMDRLDQIHLIFTLRSPSNYSSSSIAYRKFDGQNWSPTVKVSPPDHVSFSSASVVLDVNNKVHFFWQGPWHVYHRTFDGKNWTDTQLFIPYSYGRPFVTKSDSKGNIHVFFLGYYKLFDGLHHLIYDGISWKDSPNILKMQTTYDKYALENFAFDQDNNIYGAFRNRGIFLTQLKKGLPSRMIYFDKVGSKLRTQKAVTLVSDSKKNLHLLFLAYKSPNDSFYTSYYSHYNGVIWSEPIELSRVDFRDVQKLVVDSKGQIYLICSSYPSSSPKKISLGKTSISILDLSKRTMGSTSEIYGISAVVDSLDGIRIGFTEGPSWLSTQISYVRYSGGTWSKTVKVSGNIPLCGSLAMAGDSKDRVHLVWMGVGSGYSATNNSSYNYDIFYASYNGTSWSTYQNISNTPVDSFNPTIALDSKDGVHVAYSNFKSVNQNIDDNWVYYTKLAANQWSTPLKISTLNLNGSGKNPQIAIDSRDQIHLVWHETAYVDGDLYYSLFNGSFWSTPKNISNTPLDSSSNPLLAVDQLDRLHVVWSEFGLHHLISPKAYQHCRDFNGGLPLGWTTTSTWKSYHWFGFEPRWDGELMLVGNSGRVSAYIAPSETIISESYDCSKYSEVILKMDHYFITKNHYFLPFALGKNQAGEIDISVDGGANWQNLRNFSTGAGSTSGSLKIDISKFAAKKSKVRIRFYYYSDGGSGCWGVDNVEIEGK